MNDPTYPSEQRQPTYPGSYNAPPPPPRRPWRKRHPVIFILLLIFAVGFVGSAAISGIAQALNPQASTPIATNNATPVATSQGVQVTHAPVTPTATPKPKPTFATFGDGTFVVNKDIKPGTYRTRQGATGCYFARLKGFGGGVNDILANQNTDDVAITTILDSDKGFESSNCGEWTKDLSQVTTSKTSFDDGEYFVKTDITPGTYKSQGQTGCYYARLKGFSGGIDDIAANGNSDHSVIVTISASDKGFLSTRCGHWSKI